VTRPYQICTRCVMDTTDPDIQFDENGVCNHCREYDEVVRRRVFTGVEGVRNLEQIVNQIKGDGNGKQYDCVIGVSGGVDSTFVAYKAKQFGLRPLAVHLDNGWDSELAVRNIENALKKLDIDLYTLVLEWEEFKDLQLAFLKASTPIPRFLAIMQLSPLCGIPLPGSASSMLSQATIPAPRPIFHLPGLRGTLTGCTSRAFTNSSAQSH